MGNAQQRPILITGGGRRIGLALAHHFLNLRHPVIISYRSEYPSIEGLRKAGAICILADFSTDDAFLAIADKVKSTTPGLRAIIHFTDYVVERGSDKHIAYAASKAALDNMTRSFARKLAPEVKVNAIAPAMILFNEDDDAEYRQQALNKSLMKIAPGEKEVIDLIDYLLTSCYVTGRTFAVDGGRPLR